MKQLHLSKNQLIVRITLPFFGNEEYSVYILLFYLLYPFITSRNSDEVFTCNHVWL